MRTAHRTAAGLAAWRVLRRSERSGGASAGRRVRALPRMFRQRLTGRYPELAKSRMLLFALAFGYILSPVDLIPELFIPLLGLVDDIGVAAWLTAALLGEGDRFLAWEERRSGPDSGARLPQAPHARAE